MEFIGAKHLIRDLGKNINRCGCRQWIQNIYKQGLVPSIVSTLLVVSNQETGTTYNIYYIAHKNISPFSNNNSTQIHACIYLSLPFLFE